MTEPLDGEAAGLVENSDESDHTTGELPEPNVSQGEPLDRESAGPVAPAGGPTLDGRAVSDPWWSTATALRSASAPSASTRPSRRRGRRVGLVLAAAGAAVILSVILFVGAGRGAHARVSAARGRHTTSISTFETTTTPTRRLDTAAVVFSDDFSDARSGWTTHPLPSGTTFRYVANHYVVHALGSLHHFASAPYSEPLDHIAVTATATQSADAAAGSGFGVTCERARPADDSSPLRYEFVVANDGRWFVERRDGSTTNSTAPAILKEGGTTSDPVKAAVTVTGVCDSAPDDQSTQLELFVDGTQVASVTDRGQLAAHTGWYAALVIDSRAAAPVTVTCNHFTVRDLASAPSPTTTTIGSS